MQTCPYCDSELKRNGDLDRIRSTGTGDAGRPGRKNTDDELVSCPDCGGVIDGFAPH